MFSIDMKFISKLVEILFMEIVSCSDPHLEKYILFAKMLLGSAVSKCDSVVTRLMCLYYWAHLFSKASYLNYSCLNGAVPCNKMSTLVHTNNDMGPWIHISVRGSDKNQNYNQKLHAMQKVTFYRMKHRVLFITGYTFFCVKVILNQLTYMLSRSRAVNKNCVYVKCCWPHKIICCSSLYCFRLGDFTALLYRWQKLVLMQRRIKSFFNYRSIWYCSAYLGTETCQMYSSG